MAAYSLIVYILLIWFPAALIMLFASLKIGPIIIIRTRELKSNLYQQTTYQGIIHHVNHFKAGINRRASKLASGSFAYL